jgi:hypothetical protein
VAMRPLVWLVMAALVAMAEPVRVAFLEFKLSQPAALAATAVLVAQAAVVAA